MYSCPNCGSQVPTDASSCPNCGITLPLETGTTITSTLLPKSISQEKISDNSSAPSVTNLHKNLKYYHDRLLGVKLRNRSILLRQISDKWCFDFSSYDSSKKVVYHSIVDKKSICIIQNSEKSRWVESERTKLRSLYRNITQIQRETGLQETYLGFPFVAGHISKRWYVRGPLVLFPVSILYKNEGKLPGWYLSFSEDKDPILNRALMEAIKREGGLGLPETFTDDFEDLLEKIAKEIESKRNEKEASRNAESLFLNGLTNLLLENKAPLDLDNYNVDKIDILNKIDVVGGRISIDDIRSWIEEQKLHLVNYKVMGNFPQGKNAIYLDYEELVKKTRSSDDDLGVIKRLLSDVPPDSIDNNPPKLTDYGKESESPNLDDNPMDKLHLAIPSDASQDAIVLESQSSQCTVVRGPPGTGKSQVIVNLISNALANSQKVLLVCQKRAALDIVYQRLDKLGVSRYVAFLHDAVSGRTSLYKRLANILESDVSCDNITRINSKLKYYSHEINKIIGRQARIADALKNGDLVDITVDKLYVLMGVVA